jgi:hypothetical protein
MIINDRKNQAPTAQQGPKDGGKDAEGESSWLRRAQEAFRDSTTYLDNNYRKTWDDSTRSFNSQHASDSKYNAPSYEKRSRLYRPKTRSIIRKNEAAAAVAFFSNMDVVSIQATDASDKIEVASSEIMKELLQYRLRKSIPWFQIVLGGLQDAQTLGVACAHIYWDFEASESKPAIIDIPLAGEEEQDEYPEQGELPFGAIQTPHVMGAKISLKSEVAPVIKPKVDCPAIDLFPVENLRISPGANWIDPVNSSPYIIHLIPMYVMDVKQKMQYGKWNPQSDNIISAAAEASPDSTRTSRNKNREDPLTADGSLPDYNIVWVQRHIHRKDGKDWEFYTLGDLALLTSPRPLIETVFHGQRPYVIGNCILETHKLMPSSIPTLGKGLQDEANEICNQRIDNVKFVLNKKFFAKRGRDVDIAGLVRNVPGGVVMLDDPTNDVREITWPDVTASAYEEQSRIDQDMNDLLGNFSAGQVIADHGINGPAHNMALLGQNTATLTEYLLRTYVETFVQPVLRQLVLLEQKYETDQVVLGLVAKKAQLFQKFGLDHVTDELLEKELTLTVNVGMGATDPQMKLQKFLTAITTYVQISKEPVPGLNLQEVGKEVFGHLGYSDGSRFFTNDDPNIAQMQSLLQKQAKVIQDLTQKVQEKMTSHQIKKEVADITAKTKIQTTQIHEDNENLRTATTHLRAIREQDKTAAHDAVMVGVKAGHASRARAEERQMAMAQATPTREVA